MCLYTITKKVEPNLKDVRTAYKVVRNQRDLDRRSPNKYTTVCQSFEITNDWKKAEPAYGGFPEPQLRTEGKDSISYPTGFHVFPKKRDATRLLSEVAHSTVVRVEVRGVHTFGRGDGFSNTECEQWVAEWIRLAPKATRKSKSESNGSKRRKHVPDSDGGRKPQSNT